MDETTAGTPGGRALEIAVIAVAIVLQLVVLVPFTLASGLAAPMWAVAALVAVWVLFAAGLVRLARVRPLFTPVVPVANAAVLWAAIAAGGSLLGWTA